MGLGHRCAAQGDRCAAQGDRCAAQGDRCDAIPTAEGKTWEAFGKPAKGKRTAKGKSAQTPA